MIVVAIVAVAAVNTTPTPVAVAVVDAKAFVQSGSSRKSSRYEKHFISLF